MKANKSEFLGLLNIKENEPDYFVRGIEGSNSFDRFQTLWSVNRDENNEEYKKLEYLMATREEINYNTDDGSSFEAIANLIKREKTVGHGSASAISTQQLAANKAVVR